jgi:FkbM family methyltransferase
MRISQGGSGFPASKKFSLAPLANGGDCWWLNVQVHRLSWGAEIGERDMRTIAAQACSVISYVWRHPGNQAGRIRALTKAFYVQSHNRLGFGPVVVPLGERSKIYAERGSAASTAVAYGNPPDFAEMAVWRRYLRPGDIFVDVGANVGTYSVFAAEMGADVFAFEPDAANVKKLQRNLQLNDYRAEIHAVALSNSVGSLRFSSGQDSMNHLVFGEEVGSYEVPSATLDSIMGDRHIAGMKVDVEGAERLVLEGAGESLKNGRLGLIQIEWNNVSESTLREPRTQVSALLESYGYAIYRPRNDGSLAEWDGKLGRDVFAARPGLQLSNDGSRR